VYLFSSQISWGLVFVVLFSGLNEPCTGIDVFSVMGINLAATGSIM
jgi:hypothetical protein